MGQDRAEGKIARRGTQPREPSDCVNQEGT